MWKEQFLAPLYEEQGELLFSLFPTRLMSNSCTSSEDTDNSVQGSFIPGFPMVKPVFANYPSLSFCRFIRDCRAKYIG